ncbi:alpha/beta hydrolase [Zavarzinia sp. CC-PAN008]|uniref:alpha/beta hydrolase n=1 Tax=Zavarzinia sp. CC-PAN008 TaxID=3243332 RepID=UPI003F74A3DC
MTALFPGFAQHRIRTSGAEINLVTGGKGPPLLLLHGYPQTHAIWHLVAERLKDHFTLVCADLRGYGDSAKPPGDRTHAAYSKRAMAQDMVEVMSALGHERFGLVGHDRGARVSHRLCLDHEARVTRVALLDIVPTRHLFTHVDRKLAHTYFHWFFLSVPAPLPENQIGADALNWVRFMLGALGPSGAFDPRAQAEYERCFSDPATIHASCEDYRAGASIDLEHDAVDAAAGRKIQVPTLIQWGETGALPRLHDDVMAIWRQYATDVTGEPMPSNHYIPDFAPAECAASLLRFFGAAS